MILQNHKRNPERFKLRNLELNHHNSAFKIGTDSLILGAYASTFRAHSVLDIGSGCGILALMYASKNNESTVQGWDIYPPAVVEATENSRINKLDHRVQFKMRDFSSELSVEHFDLIISNPPYFLNSLQSPSKKQNLAKHHIFSDYSIYLKAINSHLNLNGVALIILPIDAVQIFITNAENIGLNVQKKMLISPTPQKPINRVILGLYKNTSIEPSSPLSLIIQNSGKRNDWTAGYIDLLESFRNY